MPLKAEVNLQRLLVRCEKMAATGVTDENELQRLETYIYHLQKLRLDIVQQSTKADATMLQDYRRKIQHLVKFLETEYLARHPEQVQSKAGDHLIVATSVGSETTEESRVRQRSKAKAAGELRAELLATNKPRAQAMGHKLSSRLSQDVDHEGDDEFEARLAAERKLQASITDDMVEMAKQLKDTSLMASSMIQEDNRTLDETTRLAEKNQSTLAKESERLRKHMEVYGSWWIWTSLLAVSVTFVWMIIFIRMFPKLG